MMRERERRLNGSQLSFLSIDDANGNRIFFFLAAVIDANKLNHDAISNSKMYPLL